MRLCARSALPAALALAAPAAFAQNQAPVLRQTFDADTEGWQAFSGRLSVTTDPALVKEGKGALKWEYNLAKGEFAFALLPTPNGALAKMKSLRFAVRTDHTTPVVAVLQEAAGGRYIALFTAPKDQWQEVALAPEDFALSDGNDDPKDPNGQLDLERVEGLGIADLGTLFAQSDDPNVQNLLKIQMGPHVLCLDSLRVTEEPLPKGDAAAGNPIDTFTRPQLSWLGFGSTRVTAASGAPLEGRGVRADYRQAPGAFVGLARPVGRGLLAGTERLTLALASLKPAKILIQLEETGGGKYNRVVDAEGASKLQKLDLAYTEFTPADDSKDANNRLDPEAVKTVLIIDLTGVFGMGEGENALWIGSIRGAK